MKTAPINKVEAEAAAEEVQEEDTTPGVDNDRTKHLYTVSTASVLRAAFVSAFVQNLALRLGFG